MVWNIRHFIPLRVESEPGRARACMAASGKSPNLFSRDSGVSA